MHNSNYRFSSSPVHLSIAGLILCLSNFSHAGSLQASYGQLEQQVTIQDASLLTKPAGGVVSLSFDVDDLWNISFDYQQWQDKKTINPLFPAQVSIDLQTWSAGVSYYHDAWSFSSQYSVANDDTGIYKGARLKDFREEQLNSATLSGAIAYSWSSTNWFYNANLATQYNDWDLHAQQTRPTESELRLPPEQQDLLIETSSGDSSSVSASLSMARFWSLEQNKGILVGALISWNYLLSGESSIITRNGRNLPPPPPNAPNAPRFNNRIPSLSSTGDDNSGQVSLYFSYDIFDDLSLDIDLARGIGSDFNGQSWSIGSSYSF